MSVYGDIRFLGEAVDSILAQSFRDFEFLIIDDGSEHQRHLEALASRDPRIRLLRNPANLGLIRSLNRGVAEARAPLIARMDADDVAHPERLARLREAMDADLALGLVGSCYTTLDESGKDLESIRVPQSHADIMWASLFYNPFCHSSVMFRRSAFDAAGGYELHAPHAEDYDLWARMLLSVKARNLPDALVKYRINSNGVSARHAEEQRRSADAVRARLWRKIGVAYEEKGLANATSLVLGFLPPGWDRREEALALCLRLYRPYRYAAQALLPHDQREPVLRIGRRFVDFLFDHPVPRPPEVEAMIRRCRWLAFRALPLYTLSWLPTEAFAWLRQVVRSGVRFIYRRLKKYLGK